jgi:hypothetical protein
VIRALATAASELAEIAADGLLGQIGDLKDRIAEKAARVGCDLTLRRASPPRDGHVVAPAIKMCFSEWTTENGVLGRELWNAEDGGVPPL